MDRLEYFHVAKLSLFNVRLLSELEQARTQGAAGRVDQVVDSCAMANGLRAPVNLLHQTTFLGHAYVVLVWLREYVWKNFNDLEKQRARDGFTRRFDWVNGFEETWARDSRRDIKKPREALRILRNALAHARVEFDAEGRWKFSNDDKTNAQDDAFITMRPEQLGALCDAVMFGYQDSLYPAR